MSQQINFTSPQLLEAVEYPGKVINVDKMLKTLGDITSVSQVLGGEHKRLELRYHPQNPFNKPVCGDSKPRAGVLLSVKVRRSKRNPTRLPQYEVRIVGHCSRLFTFENLCDFQYLPLVKEPSSSSLVCALESLMPHTPTDVEHFNRTDATLICLPQIFARVDTVHINILRNDVETEDGQHDVLGVSQKSNYDNRDVVPFSMNDLFPTHPDPQMLKRMKVKYVSDEQFDKVKKLFENCPIWTRIALLYESGVSNDKLKCITPSLAFYFSTGPWRTLYVRYGYDPRKDFQSRYYQIFDYRLRFRSGMSEFVSNRKNTIKKMQENPEEAGVLTQDLNYPYLEENRLPRSRQCMLRYCDIHMPKIQDMLEKIPSPLTGAMCNERTGWLPAGFDAQVRQVINNSIRDLLRSYHRKEQSHDEMDLEENSEPTPENEEESDDNDFLNEENLDGILEDMDIDNEISC